MTTIFSKIISGEIETEFLHEDDVCVVIRDIHPKAKTHLLIIPKKEIETIANLQDDDVYVVGHLIKVARDMGKKLGLEGYKLVFNVGEKGGQEIFHIHLHLLAN